MDVDSVHRQPELACALDLTLGRVTGEPELRFLVRRLDRAVGDRFDPWRQPHEHAAHLCDRRRVRLADRIQYDERVRVGRRTQLRFRLVVAVEDDPLAGNARGASERELAEGRDVGTDTFLCEQTAAARRSRGAASR